MNLLKITLYLIFLILGFIAGKYHLFNQRHFKKMKLLERKRELNEKIYQARIKALSKSNDEMLNRLINESFSINEEIELLEKESLFRFNHLLEKFGMKLLEESSNQN